MFVLVLLGVAVYFLVIAVGMSSSKTGSAKGDSIVSEAESERDQRAAEVCSSLASEIQQDLQKHLGPDYGVEVKVRGRFGR